MLKELKDFVNGDKKDEPSLSPRGKPKEPAQIELKSKIPENRNLQSSASNLNPPSSYWTRTKSQIETQHNLLSNHIKVTIQDQKKSSPPEQSVPGQLKSPLPEKDIFQETVSEPSEDISSSTSESGEEDISESSKEKTTDIKVPPIINNIQKKKYEDLIVVEESNSGISSCLDEELYSQIALSPTTKARHTNLISDEDDDIFPDQDVRSNSKLLDASNLSDPFWSNIDTLSTSNPKEQDND